MNMLVLRPEVESLHYALIAADRRAFVLSGRAAASAESLAAMRETCARQTAGAGPDAIAVRAIFGGAHFRRPTLVNDDTIAALSVLAPAAPLHVPAVLALLAGCRQAFPGIPAIMVFETAFFVDLPLRERSYGMSPELEPELGLRRFGYHGVFHEAAARLAMRELHRRGSHATPRTLSVCLEPRPEIAGIIGCRPLTVTGGCTPLEGLPGQTTCGEIDPGIVLHLARQLRWGPEQINQCLTRESGLQGMVGHPITLGRLFAAQDDHALALAREVMHYRMLLACGAAISALGGADQIVFSGRYRDAAKTLGPWLAYHLSLAIRKRQSAIPWYILHEPLDRLIADAALTEVSRLQLSSSTGKPYHPQSRS